jgi:DNA-binding beta-propeller fold protein YncE
MRVLWPDIQHPARSPAARRGFSLAVIVTLALGVRPHPRAPEVPCDPPVPGDLYVANLRSNEITVFHGTTGAYQCVFVAAGSGGLSGATGLAFGPDGHLYVGSSQTNQVLRYHGTTGVPLGAFVDDSALVTPFSLIFGPDGHLYVSSGRGNVVRRYHGRTGAPLGVAAADSLLVQPIGLGFGADGLLYVVNSGGRNVMRFDVETGRGAVFAADSLAYPADLAFGPDGALYVTNAAGASVARFDAGSGRFTGMFVRLPQGAAPVGLAFTDAGRLFVADFGRNRLFLASGAGAVQDPAATTGLSGPENITIRR